MPSIDTKINVDHWYKMVYQQDDIFDANYVFDFDEILQYSVNKDIIKAKIVDTMYDGRCFTITVNATKKANEAVVIVLKYPWKEYSIKVRF